MSYTITIYEVNEPLEQVDKPKVVPLSVIEYLKQHPGHAFSYRVWQEIQFEQKKNIIYNVYLTEPREELCVWMNTNSIMHFKNVENLFTQLDKVREEFKKVAMDYFGTLDISGDEKSWEYHQLIDDMEERTAGNPYDEYNVVKFLNYQIKEYSDKLEELKTEMAKIKNPLDDDPMFLAVEKKFVKRKTI